MAATSVPSAQLLRQLLPVPLYHIISGAAASTPVVCLWGQPVCDGRHMHAGMHTLTMILVSSTVMYFMVAWSARPEALLAGARGAARPPKLTRRHVLALLLL